MGLRVFSWVGIFPNTCLNNQGLGSRSGSIIKAKGKCIGVESGVRQFRAWGKDLHKPTPETLNPTPRNTNKNNNNSGNSRAPNHVNKDIILVLSLWL